MSRTDLTATLNRLLLALNRQQWPGIQDLYPGLTLEVIHSLIAPCHIVLATEVATLYQWHDATAGHVVDRPPLFPGGVVLSLEEAVGEYQRLLLSDDPRWNRCWFPLFTAPYGGEWYVSLADTQQDDTAPIHLWSDQAWISSAGSEAYEPIMAFDSLYSMILTITEAYEQEAFQLQNRSVIETNRQLAGRLFRRNNPQTVEYLLQWAVGSANVADLIPALMAPEGPESTRATTAFLWLRDERLISPLLAYLQAQSAAQRWRAAQYLGFLQAREALPSLIPWLRASDQRARAVAVNALAMIGDRQAVQPLLAELARPDIDLEGGIIAALGELRDPRAVEPLLALLPRVSGPLMQELIRVFGYLGDSRAVEPLLARLPEVDLDSRLSIIVTIGNLDDRRVVEPLLNRLLVVGEPEQEAIVSALGALRDSRALVPLLSLLESAPMPSKRLDQCIVDAIGSIGDHRSIPRLLLLLKTADFNLHISVVRALTKIGTMEAIEALKTISNSTNYETSIRAMAQRVVICHEPRAAVP